MAASGALSGSQGLTGGWLTAAQQDAIIGYPAQETYSGPVSENHLAEGHEDPGRAGPPGGKPAPPVPSGDYLPVPDLSGGVIPDTQADELGMSGPMVAFDSAAGEAFAPSGPVGDTHGYDTGGTQRKQHVPVPRSPGWFRLTLRGQTYNRQAQVTDSAGWDLNAVNNRQNLNEYQGQNANGYDPFTVPYSERPIHANFASEAHPVDYAGGPYAPYGDLANMAGLGGQGNFGYTTPPDPSVSYAPASAGSYTPSLGSEYLSG